MGGEIDRDGRVAMRPKPVAALGKIAATDRSTDIGVFSALKLDWGDVAERLM